MWVRKAFSNLCTWTIALKLFSFPCQLFNIRSDGKLLTLTRLQDRTIKTCITRTSCLPRTVPLTMLRYSGAFSIFKLTISTKKPEGIHRSTPGKPFIEPDIMVYGQSERQNFSGPVHPWGAYIPRFGTEGTLDTKRVVQSKCVPPATMLHACESFTVHQRHA